MTLMRAGECDSWNTGQPFEIAFGPTTNGNELAVYDESLGLWKIIEYSSWNLFNAVSGGNAWLDTGSGPVQGVPLVDNTLYLASTRLNPATGNVDFMWTPFSMGYVRNDPLSGIMCAPGSRRWRVTGMGYVHPVHKLQGQFNSEYYAARYDRWTVGLGVHPASPNPGNTITVDGTNWIEVPGSLDFVTWADRLPSPINGVFNVFGSWVGQSISVGIGQTAAEAAANAGTHSVRDVNEPLSIPAQYTITGGASDQYFSVKSFVKANVSGPNNFVRLGYAINSSMGNKVWF
jgi:hypothetical protein